MDQQVEAHPWAKEALIAKARVCRERMFSADVNSADYVLWSAVMLEMLARAALANISPLLLADGKDWRNLTYALGRDSTRKQFTPSSIGFKEVLTRLSELDPSLTQEVLNFCASHLDKRNAELHSGEVAFHGYGSSSWAPRFYQAASVFLKMVGLKLEDIFKNAEDVRQMIESLSDKAANSVRDDIEAYRKVWTHLPQVERDLKSNQAELWATRQKGHRAACPACACQSLVYGTPTGAVIDRVLEGEIEQKQTRIPANFECVGCGLRISGFSKLAACGLGNQFIETTRIAASEYFGLYTEDQLSDEVDRAERAVVDSLQERDYND